MQFDSYLNKGAKWQDQLVIRFQLASVVGLTLGLLLALWTLLQTMVSFKKALKVGGESQHKVCLRVATSCGGCCWQLPKLPQNL